jgi:inorganic pyrophosphatase
MLNSFPSEPFWNALLQLVNRHPVIIDRPKGTAHPRYPDFIYPVDYGYLDGTASMDQGGIDLWRGSLTDPLLNGIICTVDLNKSDSEIKLLLGCTENEINQIFNKHNEYTQAGIWIPNPRLSDT